MAREPLPCTDETVRRDLGRALKDARAAAGLTQHAAAAVLARNQATVSKIEKGRTSVSREGLRALLDLYRVPEAEATELVRAWDEVNAPARRCGDDFVAVPSWFARVIECEREAAVVRAWSGENVHGLLQSEHYMLAVFDGARRGTVMFDRMRIRGQRQKLLDETGKRFVFLLGESALDKLDALHPDIERDQLGHMIGLAGRDNIVLRLVPRPGNGYTEHNFVLMRFPGSPAERAYSEYLGGVAWTAQRDLGRPRKAWKALESVAHTAEATLEELHRRYERAAARNPDRGQ
ncbi:helix-turn-helix domain-containing protein [Amycolatopsis rubida]|uniref:Helix-turn-helix domain-containing protein n=1 Tax=Amycolatopsis rubida TaxID=112413 RepID=A0A1I6BM29_9PSEU|nr:helix-turn-helix transcriptional regulator [Amycolatopsis rubida]SFQ81961.1 Helix-turn-helix domain-containing protein [Amycolatopsis rubida]